MKKLFTIGAVCVALGLSACAGNAGDADYTYETMAPYADERTVGSEEYVAPAPAPAPKQAERIFERTMRK